MNKTVFAVNSPSTLINFLSGQFPDLSKKKIKKAIDSKKAVVNSRVVMRSNHILRKRDVVSFFYTNIPPFIEVIYEDEFLICINKPSHTTTDTSLVKDDVYLVHRLDKETSGCLLLAKTKAVQEQLEESFRKREVRKKYSAVVLGCPKKARGVFEYSLEVKHQEKGQKIMRVSKNGKHAVTHYKVVQKGRKFSSLELTPLTGRTHQIRVHCSYVGLPLVGDHVYGKVNEARLLLHADSISFKLFDNEYEFSAKKNEEYLGLEGKYVQI